MIAGILLRHFKCYENINFIPLLENFKDKYSVFVGENGIGKSAIFEALDVYFNNGIWNITKGAKKQDSYIVPIFLLSKSDSKVKKLESIKLIEIISNYFYNVSKTEINIQSNESLLNFFEFKDNIKENYDDFYILPVGVSFLEPTNIYFGSTFDNECKEKLEEKGYNNTDFNILKKELLELYNYVYLPVEQDINNTLKAENTSMQALMDKNLVKEIEEILNHKVKIHETGKDKKIIDHINEQLKDLLLDMNNSLFEVDKSYKYTSIKNNKKNLTSNDIKEKIIEAYFSIKELRKDDKSINRLSSGEKRKAMIDTVFAFLANSNYEERYQKIILAIDEPEISMHISSCFDQFIRLQDLSYKYGHQILLTTHWYGFIPISKEGSMFNIIRSNNNTRLVKGFNLDNIVDDTIRQKKVEMIPDLLSSKSIFDLASSMVSYISSNTDIKWIICEGITDKKYLEFILNDENIKVTSVGGINNVKKLYYHMYLPLMDKKESLSKSGNKLMFLIDCDKTVVEFNNPNPFSNNDQYMDKILNLYILQSKKNEKSKKNEISLENIFKKHILHIKTEIEDCLDPKIYYDSILEILPEYEDNFKFNNTMETSKIDGDSSILLPLNKSYHDKKAELKEKLDKEYKVEICNKYIEIAKQRTVSHILKDKILYILNK